MVGTTPAQVAPPAVDLDVGFVDVPGATRFSASFGAEALRDQRGKALLPFPHGLMREDEAALQEHLGEIA